MQDVAKPSQPKLSQRLEQTMEQVREHTWYQSASLAIAVALCSSLLLLLNSFTAPAIEQRLREDKLAAIDMVIPASYYHNALLDTEQRFVFDGQSYLWYQASDELGQPSGYVLQGQTPGYAGAIEFLVGLDQQMQILGVRVLSHAETPGLGDKIEIAKDQWITSFEGLSLSNTATSQWAVEKDGGQFDQFTGATITPRAVVYGVHHSLQALAEQLKPLAEQPADLPPLSLHSPHPSHLDQQESAHEQLSQHF